MREHIDALWKVLERKPEDQRPHSSRLALPHRYVVPGGRFNEIYYWDSYFTMLGLEASGRHDLTVSMLDNFAWLIDQFGHIPNGNRTLLPQPLAAAVLRCDGGARRQARR